MATTLRIAGVLLLLSGIGWALFITGAVVSRTEGFRSLAEMWPAIVFHAVCMIGGMMCLARATALRIRAASMEQVEQV